MKIDVLTKKQATAVFRSYNLPIILWTTSSIDSGKYQGVICDYTKLAGYTISYTCAVYDKNGKLLIRFNVKE